MPLPVELIIFLLRGNWFIKKYQPSPESLMTALEWDIHRSFCSVIPSLRSASLWPQATLFPLHTPHYVWVKLFRQTNDTKQKWREANAKSFVWCLLSNEVKCFFTVDLTGIYINGELFYRKHRMSAVSLITSCFNILGLTWLTFWAAVALNQ